MYRQRAGGSSRCSAPTPTSSHRSLDRTKMDGCRSGRTDTFEMRDIGPSGADEAPWGEDNDGSVGAREGSFDLLAADGLD